MATKMATKEEILESISSMSVMDLVDLISDIEEKFGVTAAAVAAAPCLLYTSPSPRDSVVSRMPSSA